MKRLILSIVCVALSAMMAAQNLRDCASLKINSENGVYAKGETVRVWADVKAVPSEPVILDIAKFGDSERTETKTVNLHPGENLLLESSYDEAVHYTMTLRCGDDGVEVTENRLKTGFIVGTEDFRPGFEEPKDVLKYWKKEFRKMRKEKMVPVISKQSEKNGCKVYELELNCVGPAPVRAYVAHPENAAKKSLPIFLYLHAAGSPGSPAAAKTAVSNAERGALSMDLNAHGMLNDQPKAYYDSLSAGPLKDYSKREPKDRDDYYFKWMLLRAQRALDYLMADPLWDGKHIIVMGTSQGGGQSSFLAAMNPEVSAAVLTVPAMLDQGGIVAGRTTSWPHTMRKYPETSAENSPYFDPGLILKHTKAHIWCEIGLFDGTCPPANLFSVLNTIKTEKTVLTWQRAHHNNNFSAKEHSEVVGASREAFIKSELVR